VLVVDASVIAPIVADDGPHGHLLRARIRDETLAAPDLLRIEVVSVIRKQLLRQLLTPARAAAAVEDLSALPIRVFPTSPFVSRIWQVRDNVAPYDACYVATAESLQCPFLTADARLGRAIAFDDSLDVAVEVFAAS